MEVNFITCGICFECGHSSNECTADKADFDLIGPMAAFVGARLQHPRLECNGRNPRISTIRVEQYKEKFWYARIYCTLAEEDEVKAKWRAEGRLGAPNEDFFARCMLHDARYYRKCYLEMVKLIPRLKRRLCAQADYSVLLMDTVQEAEACIEVWVEQYKEAPDTLQNVLRKWNVIDFDELRSVLREVYDEPATFKAELKNS
jgi:hypothetical protein